MPQSILIDYDLETMEIRRIIHPEDDSHIIHHKLEPDCGRVLTSTSKFKVDPVEGRPLYSLSDCIDEVYRQTGRSKDDLK